MEKLKLKVCGMKNAQNIKLISEEIQPDYLGLIFYHKSPRNALDLEPSSIKDLTDIKKVGVFVNESFSFVLEKVKQYGLDLVQLHGDESPSFCQRLKDKKIKIIKAIGVKGSIYPSQLRDYQNFVDYFLFDTKGENRGGNGIAFDWKVLKSYTLNIPFIIAGGITESNIEKLEILKGLPLYAIDVNSKFESKAGYKDAEKLKILRKKMFQLFQESSDKTN